MNNIIEHSAAEKIVGNYIKHLIDGNYDAIIDMFSKNATVYSPLYGQRKASAFYQELFADTNDSTIKLLGVFINSADREIAAHFHYDWELKNGVIAPFDVVDIFELDDKMKIIILRIIYDASKTQEAFNQVKTDD